MNTFLSKGIKALIFDCDGTLVDTMDAHIAAWQEILRIIGHKWTPNWSEYNGIPTVDILRNFAKEANIEIDVEHLAYQKEMIAYQLLSSVKPIPQVVDVARGNLHTRPLAVVSGGIKANVMRSLEAIGIASWFNPIITADDKLPPKPAPDMFFLAAEQMGVKPEECAVFEDGEPGLVGARSAGMLAIDVRPYI